MRYKLFLIVIFLFLSNCGHSPANGTLVKVVIDGKVVCEGIVVGGYGHGGAREDRVQILILEDNKPTNRTISMPHSFVVEK